MNFRVFNGDIPCEKLDRSTFGFSHNLQNHPSLQIENLLKILPTYPKEKVMFSKSINNIDVDLDYRLENDRRELNLSEVCETLLSGNSFIAIRNPELHSSIKGIFDDINHDISLIMKKNNTGTYPIDPNLWLFIASPNAVTPYHLDRSSNFILQIRGSKELAIFPPRDERIMDKAKYEAYLDWNGQCPEWNESFDHLAFKHSFSAGNAAHIPFISGHYVKNGPEDISITISSFFQTNETLKWMNAMRMNNRLRKLNLKTNPVNLNPISDQVKSTMFPILDKALKKLKK